MFSFLAFLAAAPSLTTQAIDAPPTEMPVFKPKWWYSSHRLDARCMIWSLYNKPEDWELLDHSSVRVRHKQSDHAADIWGNMQADACSCTTLKFQRGQKKRVGRAVQDFINHQRAVTQHQFHNHFINSLDHYHDGSTTGIQT